MIAVKMPRPVLRYYGGKYKLAEWIVDFFPAHRTYIEPFGGSASVLLAKPRMGREIYNDLDNDVFNVFHVLRNPESSAQLHFMLSLTPYARSEFEYARTSKPSNDPVEMARRTIVRSFMGYGASGAGHRWQTGYRQRRTNDEDTPAKEWANYKNAIEIFTKRLVDGGVQLHNDPAIPLLKMYDSPDTLAYLDPPYVTSTLTHRGRYNHSMTDRDHRKLAKTLRSLESMIIISGYPSALYDELYHDWEHVDTEAVTDGGTKRIERVWLNPALVARVPRAKQLDIFESDEETP